MASHKLAMAKVSWVQLFTIEYPNKLELARICDWSVYDNILNATLWPPTIFFNLLNVIIIKIKFEVFNLETMGGVIHKSGVTFQKLDSLSIAMYTEQILWGI